MKAPKKNSSSYQKGRYLELQVVDIYQQLGAIRVRSNLRLAGQQLDVYAELTTADGFLSRVGIDCKNYASAVGVNETNKSAQKLSLLRQTGKIDIGVIVSIVGFTAEASSAADELGIKTCTFADLLRQVADFTTYLMKAITKYEKTEIHQKGLYRNLRCLSESGKDLGLIDDYVPQWFASGGRFLTLLGDYGTGKTTFTERFFWEAAQSNLIDPLNTRIPVFIPLKRYRKTISIRSLITDILLHEYGVRIRDYTVFMSLNEQGRILLILDAFDEMATGAEESEVISNFREIKTLIRPQSQVILTCRTHFFKDQDQLYKVHTGTSLYKELDTKETTHTLYYLAPFTDEDVTILTHKYSPDRATEYLETIRSTYNLAELSKQPILLDMILKSVPTVLARSELVTPADLYRSYTSFWLDRDDWRTKMSHQQREYLMEQLAIYFQMNGITEIHFSKLPRFIRQKFPGLSTFRELDYFEADVRTCTFLIRDPVGNYSFVHRSFCEYFAAVCAVDLLLQGEWPEKLWKGKGLSPDTWITPETAKFSIDLVDRKNGFHVLLAYAYGPTNKGAILINILRIYSHSHKPEHKRLFDAAYYHSVKKKLDGLDYRREIVRLANKYHTENWKQIGKEIEELMKMKDGAPALYKEFWIGKGK